MREICEKGVGLFVNGWEFPKVLAEEDESGKQS